MSRIPEYPHLKLIGVRVPKYAESYIDGEGHVRSQWDSTNCIQPIVAPDNAYNALDLSALEIPEGYEIDGASAAEAFGDMEPGGIGMHPKECKPVQYVGAPNGPDTRRIRLRKIQPKTRTWVVAESCDPEMVALARTVSDSLKRRVSYRFEERPL